MSQGKPTILKTNGRNQFVVLPWDEYQAMLDRLTDLEDLRDLRKAKRQSAGKRPLSQEEVKQRYGRA
jgi:PHD/YefM family antitoxin component YafN of YafNO toxin-antitoxin module